MGLTLLKEVWQKMRRMENIYTINYLLGQKKIVLSMKCLYSMIFIIAVLVAFSPSASEGRDIKVYCHPGVLVGYEKDVPGYDESTYRVQYDLGIKWSNPPSGFPGHLKSIGLSWNVAFGTSEWEARHSLGPKLTWSLNEDWSVETMAGPAFSKPAETFAMGYHLGGGVIYKELVSLNLSYERLPVLDEYHNSTDESIESIYGGISIHGKAGTYATLVSATVFVVAAIIVTQALSEGLSGLN